MPMVLLIDADPDHSVRLEKALELAGYEVSVASSGSGALTMAKESQPDMIVSQELVGDMYGSELCSDFKGNPKTRDIPFILLLDRGSTQVAVAATRSAADMVLQAKSPTSTVVSHVGTLLRIRGLASALRPVDSGPKKPEKDKGGAPGATIQGSLEVMDLTEVTQAVSIGRKTGRLELSLPAGDGVILLDSGRVVHAEFGGEKGEGAFNGLMLASHREKAGSFSFIPVEAGEAPQFPRTIDKDLDRMLLDLAVEIDEQQKTMGI